MDFSIFLTKVCEKTNFLPKVNHQISLSAVQELIFQSQNNFYIAFKTNELIGKH